MQNDLVDGLCATQVGAIEQHRVIAQDDGQVLSGVRLDLLHFAGQHVAPNEPLQDWKEKWEKLS